jgi:hypothetical protein
LFPDWNIYLSSSKMKHGCLYPHNFDQQLVKLYTCLPYESCNVSQIFEYEIAFLREIGGQNKPLNSFKS